MVWLHRFVCSLEYWASDAGSASSRCGRWKSAISASSYTHWATASPRRPGRVLPRMIAILVTEALLGLMCQPDASPGLDDTSTSAVRWRCDRQLSAPLARRTRAAGLARVHRHAPSAVRRGPA